MVRVVVGEETAEAEFPLLVTDGAIRVVAVDDPEADDSGAGTFEKPWRTLAYAASRVQPGDVVYVRAGTYRETLEPLRGGTAGRPIMFKAWPGERPVLDGTGLPGTPDGIRIDGSRVRNIGHLVFSCLTLVNYHQSIQIVLGANNVRLLDLNVGFGEGGLYLYGARDIFVGQCVFHDNANFGVVFNNYTSNVLVRDSTSERNAAFDGGGFEADFSVSNVTLFRCDAIDNAGDGFDLRVDQLVLNECRAINNTNGIHLWRNAHVQNTIVHDNLESGVILDRLVGGSPVHDLVNVTVAGRHSEEGIAVREGVAASISNTISVGGRGAALRVDDPGTSLTVRRMIVHTSGVAGEPAIRIGRGTAAQPALQSASLMEQFGGEIVEIDDPEVLFEDYAIGDLRLRADSPARDTGVDQVAPDYDILRNRRGSDNGRFDVGAYEYVDLVRNAAGAEWMLYQ